MLTSLRIQNFKSWIDTGEMRFAPITGLFGTNSSGKSGILQFLLLMKQTVESPDRAEVLNFGGDPRWPVDLGSFREVVHRRASLMGHARFGEAVFGGEPPEAAAVLHRHRPLDALKWSLSWTPPMPIGMPHLRRDDGWISTTNHLRLDGSVRDVGTDDRPRPVVESFQYSSASAADENLRTAVGMLRLVGESDVYELIYPTPVRPDFKLPAPVKCYAFPTGVAEYWGTDLPSDSVLAFERLMVGLRHLGPLREEPQREYRWAGARPSDVGRRGELVVAALLAERPHGDEARAVDGPGRTLEQTVASWLKRLGLVHDSKVVRLAEGLDLYRVVVQQVPAGTYVPLTDVGFGVSQILPVLTLCYYAPRGATIILEQPEIHLHPSVQAGLADVLIDAVTTRGVQIILESHSEHLLTRLQRRIAEQALPASDAALYFCEMEQTGASRLLPLNMDEFGNITNWPHGFFGDEFAERSAMLEAEMRRRMSGAGG